VAECVATMGQTIRRKGRRMKQGLSVIMTIRGDEPKAAQTAINARDAAGCPVEVVAVYDGTEPDSDLPVDQILAHRNPRGIGPSRHKGIMAAKYAVVLLVDAHMDFEPGYGKVILEHFRKRSNYKDVTCGRCIPSMLDLSPMSGERGYTGARFSLKSEETGGEKWCLSGKWSAQDEGEIGCVFGACYGFRRAWYKEIGEPLNLLRGWFGDEEYLSISSWLAGGRVVLLDYWTSHLFRDKPSFDWNRSDMMYPAVNRARLVDLFPAEPMLKEDLHAWLAMSIRSVDQGFISAYNADKVRPEVVEARKLWESWADNVPAFLERWVDAEATPLKQRQKEREAKRPWKSEQPPTNRTPVKPAPQPMAAPRVQQRNYIECSNCGQRNSFRVSKTMNVNGGRRRYGRCANPNCKQKGVMVDRTAGQVIYWGKDATKI